MSASKEAEIRAVSTDLGVLGAELWREYLHVSCENQDIDLVLLQYFLDRSLLQCLAVGDALVHGNVHKGDAKHVCTWWGVASKESAGLSTAVCDIDTKKAVCGGAQQRTGSVAPNSVFRSRCATWVSFLKLPMFNN